MAKKAGDDEPPAKRGRPKAANPKVYAAVAVTLRGQPEWVKWLDTLCESLDVMKVGIDRTQAIDYALKLLGEKQGLPDPPSRL